MAILDFQKPDKVIMLQSSDTFGKFEFRPLEPRYGITIGNALRRVLLSSLEGFAITSVKIEGVDHEFATIKGVIEGVIDIILNLKKIRFKREVEGQEGETVVVSISGQKEFTAADIAKNLSSFSILNPNEHICFMEEKVKLKLTLTIGKGRGWVPAEENKAKLGDAPLGTIAIDSIYTPIVNVKYNVNPCRIEQKTDYESLDLEITTDGSIHPQKALEEAAKILIYHFALFSDDNITVENENEMEGGKLDEGKLKMRKLLMTPLSDLNLSVRAINCLKSADVETLADLVSHSENELKRLRNFGNKSLVEIKQKLDEKKLSFGMDVSEYGL